MLDILYQYSTRVTRVIRLPVLAKVVAEWQITRIAQPYYLLPFQFTHCVIYSTQWVCRCSVAEFSTCVINCDKTVMARKDLENVLRNLYCFLEILQTSRSEDVSSWDKQSLDNALKWAAFAEQVISDSKIPFHIQFIHALLHFPGYIMRLTFDLQNSA